MMFLLVFKMTLFSGSLQNVQENPADGKWRSVFCHILVPQHATFALNEEEKP